MTDFTKLLQPGDTGILRDGRRVTISFVEVNAPGEVEFVIRGYDTTGANLTWASDGGYIGRLAENDETMTDLVEREIDPRLEPAKAEQLTYRTPDRNGKIPDLSILGDRKRHSGNGKIYTIVAFSWNGDTDEWNNVHVGPDGILINRPLDHWTGRRANGEMRYSEAL